jgi:hypothetical protein
MADGDVGGRNWLPYVIGVVVLLILLTMWFGRPWGH